MYTLQYAQKLIKKSIHFLTNSTKNYILGLLLSTDKKNCSAMSISLGVSYSSIYQFFDDFEHHKDGAQEFFATIVKLYATQENPGILIVDTTQIIKLYAKELKVLCYDRNGSIKLPVKGMSCVTAAWTNGKVLIPLDFDFWIRKKDMENNEGYKKKTEISEELIRKWRNKIPFAYVSLDGDYGNEYFIRFLHNFRLSYFVRMPKNRHVVINGKELALADHPVFQLKRNERYKTVKCLYKGIPAYVTSHKRKGPRGTKQIVFVVSNVEGLSPKQYIEAYKLRWSIEKMFRTLKQHLGLQQCQSRFVENQRAHIFATFLAFTELEIQKENKNKRSPEEVLKDLRVQNTAKINPKFKLGEGFIM